MRMNSFWGHFEETVRFESISNSDPILIPTQTRQREEPDQRKTLGLANGTSTLTKQREEPDQDVSSYQYSAIPYGTRTLTEQREEPDQDISTSEYSALPKGR